MRLARKFRRHDDMEVVLVDQNPSHIWKPLFHEVATGSMDSYHDEAAYRSLARKRGFTFVLGRVNAVDLEARTAIRGDDGEVDLTPIELDILRYLRAAIPLQRVTCYARASTLWGLKAEAIQHLALLVFHQGQQHEHLVTELVGGVGRDEQPAIAYERHIGQVQGALVLDCQRQ